MCGAQINPPPLSATSNQCNKLSLNTETVDILGTKQESYFDLSLYKNNH